jgi:hypothetical protein
MAASNPAAITPVKSLFMAPVLPDPW